MIRWTQLVRAAQGGKTPRETRETLDAAFGAITAAVARGEEVVLRGFGTFKAVRRAAKYARNPKRGEALTIPPHLGVKFRAAKAFRDRVAEAGRLRDEGKGKEG